VNWKISAFVALLVLLSGCSTLANSPSDTPTNSGLETSTTTPTDAPATTQSVSEPRVDVLHNRSALRGVNATKVWHRVGHIVGADSSSAPIVNIRTVDRPNETRSVPQFYESLGATKQPYTEIYGWRARYTGDDVVVLRPYPNTSAREIEAVLAHEFAHAYQSRGRYGVENVSHVVPRRSVKEGTAELVSWRYADRYMPKYDWEEVRSAIFSEARTYRRIGMMPYVRGAQYARNFSDADAVFETMYENPPTTAEQVLHGLPPGSEPPRPLTVSVDTVGWWSWDTTRTGRWGEAPLRYALSIGLTREQARSAAAGWGNDRRMRFVSSDGEAWAWVIRWDDTEEATEFRAAIDAYRKNVSVPLALRDVSPKTTVLVSGNATFVRNATVSGTSGNVTITLHSRAA